ncbi:MAG: hypothetical protein EOP55_13255 [Sphingobacteriales bacterium]|nr:MAG: hypothetical protein EOP55_13255 [Sphingobacteriales bacterium]
MHPYIEIVFCVTLISLGLFMLQKLAFVKRKLSVALNMIYAERKCNEQISRNLMLGLILTVFMLGLVIISLILIEKGMINVVWDY